MRTPQYMDDRSLAMHQLVVAKIRHDPALFAKAQTNVSRWQTMACARTQPYLQDWQSLINLGVDECLAVAVEDSARANALRQSSPFAGVLSHQERNLFLKNWDKLHAARAT
jgi:hypothetical protein